MFDIVFIDAEKDDYERLFQLARDKVEPGGLFVADNVLSHADPLAEYSKARQADPTLESVTVPLDRGLELLRSRSCSPGMSGRRGVRPYPTATVAATAERRWSGLTDSSTGSGGTSG